MIMNALLNSSASIDTRLTEHATALIDWPVSRVYFKHESRFPWFVLVPRFDNAVELLDLPKVNRHALMDEIAALQSIIKAYFKPSKLNVGALGNIVSQLHVHVIGRFEDDAYWPQSIWHKEFKMLEYRPQELAVLIESLQILFKNKV